MTKRTGMIVQRELTAKRALASAELSECLLSPVFRLELQRYVDGCLSLDELLILAKKHHETPR